MANISLIQRYNDLNNSIRKAKTYKEMNGLDTDVREFYSECKDVDNEYATRILDMYVNKLHEMVSDNSAAYDTLHKKMDEIKSRGYDFDGEKDDTAAVQTKMLQLMGQLPKTKTKANAYVITNTINEVIASGVIGCKAVLSLVGYPAYADMVDERQRLHAVEGSKSAAQRAAENGNKLMLEMFGKECADVFNEGFKFRGLEKRLEQFQKSIRNEENTSAPSFWG